MYKAAFLPLPLFYVMELDKFEFEIRDILLEAFGKQDSLTREHLLELFDYDEPMAAAIVGVLSSDGLVAEVGLSEQNYLPVLLVKKPTVAAFLQNGGYTRQFELAQENAQLVSVPDKQPQQAPILFQPKEEEPQEEITFNGLQQHETPQFAIEDYRSVPDAKPDDLQQLNAVLQKENKQYRQTLRERDEEIKSLNLKLKQQEYLKLLWWLAGALLLVIILLSYKLHVKIHQSL
ncbi:hypothetical protein [Mucilaginibacter frigoritolerans]|uniref:hypothetical protein n=1 Tax=Mucilaginibacter frigoritolerans TaxID=652788 RepID=UPI0014769549|nr:hypothetical protein [Mucilaginibacter frigoritolerans]